MKWITLTIWDGNVVLQYERLTRWDVWKLIALALWAVTAQWQTHKPDNTSIRAGITTRRLMS